MVKISATKILGYKEFIITFVDSPGYSKSEDLELWVTPIIEHIKSSHIEYHNRKEDPLYNDSRIHLCLFFMRGFTESEVSVLKEIQKVTNVVPVLTKIDLLTSGEINTLKKRIRRVSSNEEIDWLDCYKISQVTFCLP